MPMNDKLEFGNRYDTQHYNYMIETNGEGYYLRESDFYTTSDDRVLESYVEVIEGGYSFGDYCEDFFEILEEEGYWD